MIEKLPSFKNLIKHLQRVPYLASRHVYRIAQYFLEMDEEGLKQFCDVLLKSKENLVKCSECCVWREKNRACLFCSDKKRDKSILCVVETWYDLWAIERTGSFSGVYHVLGGSICPLEGVGPEDLAIDLLVNRVFENSKKDSGEKISEIILALNQTPEGEATSAYIARKLEASEVKVTCLARGIPVGAALEMLDKLTLHKALNDRRLF